MSWWPLSAWIFIGVCWTIIFGVIALRRYRERVEREAAATRRLGEAIRKHWTEPEQ